MKKKKVLIALGAVVVVALAAVSGTWFVTAKKTKEGVVAFIDKANAGLSKDGLTFKIGYKEAKTGGFPTHVSVRLVDPTLTITETAADGSKPVDFLGFYDGHIDIVTDHLRKQYRAELAGNDSYTLKSGDQSMAIKGEGSKFTLLVQARSLDAFRQWETLDFKKKQDVVRFMETIHSASFDAGKLHYKDATSGETAFTQDESLARVTSRSSADILDLDLELTGKGSQVSKAYMDVIENMIRQPGGEALATFYADAPFSAVRAGKQDVDIKGSIYMTMKKDAPEREFRYDFSRAYAKNDFYEISMPSKMSVKMDATGMKIALFTDTTMDVKPAATAETGRAIAQNIAMLAMFMPKAELAEPQMVELNTKIMAALPTLSTLGPVNYKLDLAGDVGPDKKGAFNLNTFALTHKRWGLEANGAVENRTGPPTVTLSLTCRQCNSFTHDTMVTAIGMQDIKKMLKPESQMLPLGEPLLAAINGLLSQVGAKGTDGSLVFAVTTPAPGDIRLNQRPLGEVMMQAMAALQPVLNPAPAAAQPPVPDATKKP